MARDYHVVRQNGHNPETIMAYLNEESANGYDLLEFSEENNYITLITVKDVE